MKPTDYLFIAAIVIVLSLIFFNSYGPAVIGSFERSANQIRKAGVR